MRILQVTALVLVGLALSMIVSPSWAASCWPGSVRVTDPVGAKLKSKFPPSQYGMISLLHVKPTLEAFSIVDSCRGAGMSLIGNYQAGRIALASGTIRVVLVFEGPDLNPNVENQFFLHNEVTGEVRRVPGPDNVQDDRAVFILNLPPFVSFIYPRHFAPPRTSRFTMTTHPVTGKLGRLTLTMDSDGYRRSRPGLMEQYRAAVGYMKRRQRAKR